MLLLIGMIGSAGAQGFSVTQDPSLAFFEDDHGNKPFTPNLRFKVMLEEFQGKYGYPVVNLTYEYADLASGSYNRYQLQSGFAFYTIWHPLEITPLVGYGVIVRDGATTFSWEFETDFTIWINDNIGIVWSGILTQRTDAIYESSWWGYSNHVGIKIEPWGRN